MALVWTRGVRWAVCAPAIVLLSGLASGSAQAQTNNGKVSFTVGADFSHAYFFRGIRQEREGFITQPYADMSISLFENPDGQGLTGVSFSVGQWNSLHSGSSGSGRSTADPRPRNVLAWYESDFFTGVALTIDNWEAGITYTSYMSPNDSYGTVQEIALGLQHGRLGLSRRVLLIAPRAAGHRDQWAGRRRRKRGRLPRTRCRTRVWISSRGSRVSDSRLLRVSASATTTRTAWTPVSPLGFSNSFGYFDIGAVVSVPLPMPESYGSWEFSGGLHLALAWVVPRIAQRRGQRTGDRHVWFERRILGDPPGLGTYRPETSASRVTPRYPQGSTSHRWGSNAGHRPRHSTLPMTVGATMPSEPTAPSSPETSAEVLRQPLRAARDELTADTRLARAGIEATARYSAHVDDLIGNLYREARGHSEASLALVALGGYGRNHLCLYSDIDILILFAEPIGAADERFLKSMLHPLWDLRLEVGHHVRDLSDLEHVDTDNPEFLVALRDARFLAGDRAVFDRFSEICLGLGSQWLDPTLAALRDLMAQRYARSQPNAVAVSARTGCEGLPGRVARRLGHAHDRRFLRLAKPPGWPGRRGRGLHAPRQVDSASGARPQPQRPDTRAAGDRRAAVRISR